MKNTKVAVLLAGCGHLDGSEINESVMTLLALRLEGLEPEIFASELQVVEPVDYLTRNPCNASVFPRGIDEAAKIARGQIKPFKELNPDDFAALAIPGGFGVAKNFCNYASRGPHAEVDADVERIVSGFLDVKKPIMAVCIAPVVLGLVAAKKMHKLSMTLGNPESEAARNMILLGHNTISCSAREAAVDQVHKVVTTPAYMLEINLDEAWVGISKSAHQIAEWVGV